MVAISHDEVLASHTTLRVGGRAKYFATVRSLEELKEACLISKRDNLAVFVLGGGSNVLVSDDGFDGLVIKIDIQGVSFQNNAAGTVDVIAGAGENWDSLVLKAIERGLYGIENLSFIPGTVGATPIQNVGAYGSEVKDVIHFVDVFDKRSLSSKRLSNEECHFAYRDSVFKREKDFIVTRVSYRLHQKRHVTLDYRDVKEELGRRSLSSPSLKEIREIISVIRRRKFPHTAEVGTAGSFFRNLILPMREYEALKVLYPGLPAFEREDRTVKVPLAWILDRKGWKGYRRGNVGVFENQPLVLVNYGGASARELKQLSDNITADMKKEKIDVIPEVTFIGEF
jgi:UDP-N-acetylmuramate dehydrogenase